MPHYFTSDPHLSHNNILKFKNRPYASVVEMNKAYMECWNDTVGDKDDIWLLGDLTLLKNTDFIVTKFLDNLRGYIHIVPGNHDYWCNTPAKQLKILSIAKNAKNIHFAPPLCELRFENELVIMCHYPLKSWNKKHYGSIQLHGHTHSKTKITDINQFDVGWDAWYKIPSFKDILELRLIDKPKIVNDIIEPEGTTFF
jgi:calcineurin-like phosphoesterase family protein